MPGAKRRAAKAAVAAAGAAKRRTTTSAQRELQGAPSYNARRPTRPGPQASALPGTQPLPKRNAKNELVFADHPELRPNLTPAQVLQLGSFGGTYFRPIDSGTTGKRESDAWKEFPKEWFAGLDVKKCARHSPSVTVVTPRCASALWCRELTAAPAPRRQVTRSMSSYDPSVNKFGVKCGGSLDMWETSGWISALDPYGWFQWYCRFYLGRRSTDDERQIARALGVMGPKGRFRNQLIGKCSAAGAAFDDPSISPVIRQSLQHWGYHLTQADADAYCRKKSIRPLPRKD